MRYRFDTVLGMVFSVLFFMDPSCLYSYHHIEIYKKVEGVFMNTHKKELSSGTTINHDLYKIKINVKDRNDLLLIFETAQVDRIYFLINGNKNDTLKYGTIVPEKDKPYQNRNIILPLEKMDADTTEIEVIVTTNANYNVPVSLKTKKEHHSSEIIFYSFIGLYSGVLVIFALFQVITLFRYKVYNYNFYYLLYLIFTYCYFMSEFGLLKLNIIESYPNLEETLTFIIISGSCFFLLYFTYDFTRESVPKVMAQIVGIINTIIIGNVILTVSQLYKIQSIYPLVFYSVLSCVVISFVLAFALVIASTIGGLREGKFLLFSFFFLVFGTVLKPLSISGIVPHTNLSDFGAIVGHLLEIVIISSVLINIGYNEIIKSEKLKSENYLLEKTALSSQINPHFIFNCLNAIQHYILENDKEKASAYLTKFSRLIRISLNAANQQSIKLGDEISFLNSYIKLEQLRHHHKFTYELIIADASLTDQLLIPPMLIQPFVENAIIHGFRGKTEKCKLKIEFKRESDYLMVKVTDNGNGISKSLKDVIHKSMGSNLTKKRLELINDHNKEHVTYRSIQNEGNGETGTEVLILIKFL